MYGHSHVGGYSYYVLGGCLGVAKGAHWVWTHGGDQWNHWFRRW